MEYKDCKHYQRAEEDTSEFVRSVNEKKEQIMEDMRSLGLVPERMISLVGSAALLAARAERISMQAAITPMTYNEVSREGNVKPVTHPIHTMANSVTSALCNALKQLGIYASADKVQTDVRKDGGVSAGVLDSSPYGRIGEI